MAAAINKPGARILDTRTEEEFAGIDLRGNPRGGAIPSSTNLNWEDTLEGEFQSFKSADELTILFESHGLSTSDDIITYCQGAGRAAHELFVLYLMGYNDLRSGSRLDGGLEPTEGASAAQMTENIPSNKCVISTETSSGVIW